MRRDKLRFLEATKAAAVLIYLLEKKEAPLTTLTEDLRLSRSTVYNTLRALLEAGLISERREEKVFPRRRLIFLTEKGKKVAELLKEVEKILGDA